MAAQANPMMVDQFSGICLKVALASDPMAPAHSDGDIIVSEETNTGGGAVGRDAPLEVPEVVGSVAATGSEISEDEDFGELGGVVVDGALATVAEESPAPGTTKSRKRP